MPDLVNLNRVRKARAAAQAKQRAAENRALFGRSKAQKATDAAALAKREAVLDGALRAPPSKDPA